MRSPPTKKGSKKDKTETEAPLHNKMFACIYTDVPLCDTLTHIHTHTIKKLTIIERNCAKLFSCVKRKSNRSSTILNET